MLRFFKIGFFMAEPVFDRLLLGCAELAFKFEEPGCNGPYSQVTSQSLSQLSVSGETVPNLFFDFIHVLHEAFSSRAAFA